MESTDEEGHGSRISARNARNVRYARSARCSSCRWSIKGTDDSPVLNHRRLCDSVFCLSKALHSSPEFIDPAGKDVGRPSEVAQGEIKKRTRVTPVDSVVSMAQR
jgi:hypothetical protein